MSILGLTSKTLETYIKESNIPLQNITAYLEKNKITQLEALVRILNEHKNKPIETLNYELLLQIRGLAQEAAEHVKTITNPFFPFKKLPDALTNFIATVKPFCVPPESYADEYSNIAYQLSCTDINQWEMRHDDESENEGFLLVSKKFKPEEKASMEKARKSITSQLIAAIQRDYHLIITEAEFEKYFQPSLPLKDPEGKPYSRLCFDMHPLVEKILDSKQKKSGKQLKKSDTYPLVIEVAFVLDITSSMQAQIDAAKKAITLIQGDLQTKYPHALIRFACIAYRDYKDTVPLQKRPFTTSEQMEKFLNTLEADGGGDLAEMTEKALDEVCDLDWTRTNDADKQQLIRLVTVISDSPPHCVPKATYTANGDGDVYSDDYPTRTPENLYWETSVKKLTEKVDPSINTLTCIQCYTTDGKNRIHKLNKTTLQIHDEIAKRGKGKSNVLENVDKFRKEILDQVAHDIQQDNKYRAQAGLTSVAATPLANTNAAPKQQPLPALEVKSTVKSSPGETNVKSLASPSNALSGIEVESTLKNSTVETNSAPLDLNTHAVVRAAVNDKRVTEMVAATVLAPDHTDNNIPPSEDKIIGTISPDGTVKDSEGKNTIGHINTVKSEAPNGAPVYLVYDTKNNVIGSVEEPDNMVRDAKSNIIGTVHAAKQVLDKENKVIGLVSTIKIGAPVYNTQNQLIGRVRPDGKVKEEFEPSDPKPRPRARYLKRTRVTPKTYKERFLYQTLALAESPGIKVWLDQRRAVFDKVVDLLSTVQCINNLSETDQSNFINKQTEWLQELTKKNPNLADAFNLFCFLTPPTEHNYNEYVIFDTKSKKFYARHSATVLSNEAKLEELIRKNAVVRVEILDRQHPRDRGCAEVMLSSEKRRQLGIDQMYEAPTFAIPPAAPPLPETKPGSPSPSPLTAEEITSMVRRTQELEAKFSALEVQQDSLDAKDQGATRKLIESDPDLKAYFLVFRKHFQAIYIACLVISSGMVTNSQSTKLGYLSSGIETVGQNLPGLALLLAILNHAVKALDDRNKAIFVKKIVDFFAGLPEAMGLIDILAMKLVLAQKDLLKNKGAINTQDGFVNKLKAAKNWLLVNDINTPVKELAVDHLAKVIQAICEGKLGVKEGDYCQVSDLPKVFGCVCPKVDYESVKVISNAPALNATASVSPGNANIPSDSLSTLSSNVAKLMRDYEAKSKSNTDSDDILRQLQNIQSRVATMEKKSDMATSVGNGTQALAMSPIHAGGGVSLLELQQQLAVVSRQVSMLTDRVGLAAEASSDPKKEALDADGARAKLFEFVSNTSPTPRSP